MLLAIFVCALLASLCAVGTLTSSPWSNSPAWTHSPDALRFLSRREFELYQYTRANAPAQGTEARKVREWLEDFEDSSMKHAEGTKDGEKIHDEIVGHPLMGLRMIWRYAKLQEDMLEIEMEGWMDESHRAFLATKFEGLSLPSEADLEQAMELVVNLRYTYDLNVTDLIHGKIGPIQTNVGLTPIQAYEIALHCEEAGKFSEAIIWFQAQMVEDGDSLGGHRHSHSQLESELQRIVSKHDSMIDKLGRNQNKYWDEEFEYRFMTKVGNRHRGGTVFPLPPTLKDAIVSRMGYWSQSHTRGSDSHKHSPNHVDDTFAFRALCNGLKPSGGGRSRGRGLICFTESRTHPYWVLQPLRVEVFSWDPWVVQFYDVVDNATIAHLRTQSEGLMTVAQVELPEDKERVGAYDSKSRVGSHAFLYDRSEEVYQLYRKIELITGLPAFSSQGARAAQVPQIGVNAFGGGFLPHHDYMHEGTIHPLFGDTLATFMIYMNHVQLGGATAFPRLGFAVKPVKGSALFWFNLRSSGAQDERTLHGGCPVLMGEKWVSTTWFDSFASFQARPCAVKTDQ